MPALITGAGLVGSLAAARLTEHYDDHPILYDIDFQTENLREYLDLQRVTLSQGDITDQENLVAVLRASGADRIFHTAGLLAQAVRQQPLDGARVNVLGTLNVLEAARLTGVKRVVFCGSIASMLGLRAQPADQALTEDFCLDTESEYPPSIYASMKLATEWVGHAYQAQHGLEFVSLRLSGVFSWWRGSISGQAGQIIQRLLEQTWRGEPVPVSATELVRPANYIHAADAAQAGVRALLAPSLAHRVYNVAMDRNYTVAELVPLVEAALGRKVFLEVQAATASEPVAPFPLVDMSRVRRDLGWTLEYPMERAVADCAARMRTPRAEISPAASQT
jgi:nucleoside-diphosphate-sugar epimerase